LYFQLFIQLRNNKEICPKEDKSNLLNQLFYSHSMGDFWLCRYVVVAGILAFEM